MMIFFGGILVEKFGYKKLLGLAFVMHLVSAGMLFYVEPAFSSLKDADSSAATISGLFGPLVEYVYLFNLPRVIRGGN